MSISKFFKAYDLRGTTPELNSQIYYWAGFGLITKILKPENLPLSVILMRDCRLSSPEFYKAFAKGIEDAGGLVISLGIGTTDLMYAASMSLNLPGAMITASHNPAPDNGLKIVKKIPQMLGLKDGLDKIRNFVVSKIEIEKVQIDLSNLPNYEENVEVKNQIIELFLDKVKEIGKVDELLELAKSQNSNSAKKLTNSQNLNKIEKNNSNNSKFKKLKVVVDTANGMGGFVMPYLQTIYADLIDFVPLFWTLNGSFPNHAADPMNPENLKFLQQKVLEEKADFGIAMDGDADRAFFMDEKGDLISGEHLVALFAEEILKDNFENGEPKTNQNFTQNQASFTLDEQIKDKKINSIYNFDSKTGDNSILIQKTRQIENQEKNKENIDFNPAIVYVISYSRALADTVLENNGIPIISRQGHTFVKSQMSKYKAIYGGEASGHHYFGQFGFMDSGAITIALFIKIIILKNLPKQNLIQNSDQSSNSDKLQNLNSNQEVLKASQLCLKWSQKYFVSGEQNFTLPENLTMAKVIQIIKQNYQVFTISELDGITVYDTLWKFTIRGSNTEPLLRINIETKIENKTKQILTEIKEILNLD